MSYQQKKVLVTVFTGIALFYSYCTLILSQYNIETNSNDLRFWANSMLLFIGISIVINIVVLIVFHILLSVSIAIKEGDDKGVDKKIKQEMVEDERDHLFSLKSLRVGYFITGVGIVMGLFSLIFNYSPAIMLNIIFLSCMLGSILEGVVQFYLYSKHQ